MFIIHVEECSTFSGPLKLKKISEGQSMSEDRERDIFLSKPKNGIAFFTYILLSCCFMSQIN